MSFWNLKTLSLEQFRPGIESRVESGANLIMAYMEIAPGKEGIAHAHPFDQCGVVVEGQIEMLIGEEKKLLGPTEAYFIPAGVNHNWRTVTSSAKIVDVVVKQSS